jgi:CoA:oxalate CoA-transferase
VQGMGGIMSVTGFPGGQPTRVGMSIGDVGSGLYTAVAVNAALLHRFRTGEATKVDIAMFDCQLALLEGVVVRYTSEGVVPGPVGSRHATITPFQSFKTKDGNLIIAAGNDSLFVRLCNGLGKPGMGLDPDYLTNALRQKNQKRLEAEIEAILADKTTAEWIKIIGDAGVPCGPINNIAQALQHPQVEARNMLVTVPDGEGGTLKISGNPLKMSAFPDPPTRDAAPDLDANRAAILKELGLG